MNSNDDLETRFSELEPVEARPEFMRRLREIPLSHPKPTLLGFPRLFGDMRLVFGFAAALLGGLWLGSTEFLDAASNEDVVAFLALSSGSVDAEPFDVGLLE
jgi:hypothetical protein